MSQAQAQTAAPKKDAPKKVNLAYQRDKARELVKGKFIFHEVPGGSVGFVFREFKGDEIQRYDLVDGEIYTLPLGVARHLNNHGWYPEYGFVTQEQGIKASPFPVFGNQAVKVTKKTHRYAFQSLDFIDIEDMPTIGSGVIMVESV